MNRQELIDALRSKAESKGITHREIAEGVGMKRASVSRVLANRFDVKADTLIKISEFLGMEMVIQEQSVLYDSVVK